jgi:hypothetical protein
MSQERESTDLEGFIDKHHKLLTVIGVFGGLTAVFLNVPNEGMATFLSFWSFLVFGVLCWELFTKFPTITALNSRLVLFQFLTMFLAFAVFLYVAVVYWAFSLIFGGLFALLFSGAILAAVARFSIKHKRTGEAISIALWGIFVIVIVFAVLFIIVAVIALICYLLGIPIPWMTTT